MNIKFAMIGTAAVLAVAVAAGVSYWSSDSEARPTEAAVALDEDLPLPPVPPRIAQGERYEDCLTMLNDDPQGASGAAETWLASGGGDGAAHCLALAKIALGNSETGAEMLESLASRSSGTAVARASVYAQAGQAWLMAGNEPRAIAAATLALSLSPDDPDLLIDRAIDEGGTDQYQNAIDDLTHALEIDPRRVDAMVLRGSAWRHEGRLELAQDDIDRALGLDPDNAEALLERGILRQRRNDRKGARTDWERAADLAPDTPTADLAQQNLALLDAGPDRR